MHLKQFYLGCLAHASYLVADPAAGLAAVVDPQRDIEIYLEEAARLHVRIRYVFLTHFHADFLAGHLELRDRVGAEICLGSGAKAEYAFRPLADGEELALGSLRLRALHTPGHTPESITLLVFEAGAGEPHAALTGDTLFLGDVGRPDLRVSLGWSARDLGTMLYDSLHQKILRLPDATLVYPAHGAGSLCGKNISNQLVGTIGDQRRLNYALQPMSKDDFLRIVLADQPDAPAYFTYDAVRNTQERPVLDASLERNFRPLTFDAAAAAHTAGAVLLDTRPPGAHARAHWRGAINIPLEGAFATWCGTLLAPDVPIVVIADPGREHEVGVRLGRIGFDRVAGFLDGGMSALARHPELIVERLRLHPAALTAAPEACLLDVRTPNEHAAGALDRSLHIPLGQLPARRAELPRDRLIVAYCQGGYRSAIAASLLQSWGMEEIADLEGGYAATQALH
ncbi:MAG TPA: MBL fold metallo-hydrolase [Terriglobales bacterium]|nr:MBL fold metallo-hydrolase [Terriglobales bacterium]